MRPSRVFLIKHQQSAAVMLYISQGQVGTQDENKEKACLDSQIMPLRHAADKTIEFEHLGRNQVISRLCLDQVTSKILWYWARTVWLLTKTVVHPSNSFFMRAAHA